MTAVGPVAAGSARRWSGRLLPVLLLLSGFCGISYEILYSKLLGNLLGNQFTINATVLLTFLCGIGLGTLYAHRWSRWLWAIEAGIGLYAAGMVWSYGAVDRLLYTWVPALGTNLYACAGASVVLLAVPTFLIGCSVPLFASYLGTLRSAHVFSWTYGLYNVGAGVTALAMEFALLRAVGLRSATLVLAGLNVVVAGGLWALGRWARLGPSGAPERARFPVRVVAALVVASVSSAVFQLMMIKLAEFVFGPYNETFSLVLATVLLGLAVGSLLAGRYGLTFRGAMLVSLGGLVWLLAGLPAAVRVYAALYPAAVESYPLLVGVKLGLVATLMGLPAAGFGATIPALLRTHRDVARESGQLLFWSSMANAVGFLSMAFVLHRYLDYGPLIVLVAGGALAAAWIHGGRGWAIPAAALACTVLALGARAKLWNETLLYVGHMNFHSATAMEQALERFRLDQRFKGPQDVFAITRQGDEPLFFINGYVSIALAGENASEKLVGALASMLAPRLDRALVLGMGSGATAGAVGVLWDRTDVVEINHVVLENLWRMSEYNFDIESLPAVRIVHDDGIHFIKTTPERYSLILNTVTTPLYFSSSKLYTRDFFDLVRHKLTPDGVYLTWVDSRIGDHGFDIILETLDTAFAECWLSYMNTNYFLLACSDEPLGVRQLDRVARNPRLAEHFAADHALPLRLLPYSVISTDALALRSASAARVNTLDFPVLEFEMAQLQDWTELREFKRILGHRLDLRALRDAATPGMRWEPGEFSYFADMRIDPESTLGRLLRERVVREFGTAGADYAAAAASAAEEVGTARAFLKAGRRLARRDLAGPAEAAFLRAADLDPSAAEPLGRLGELQLERGAPAEALGSFRGAWEREPEAQAALGIARAQIELRAFGEALDWLERAEEADGVGRDDEIAYHRGRAWEGRREPERARAAYARALEENPGFAPAREALERLGAAREGAGS